MRLPIKPARSGATAVETLKIDLKSRDDIENVLRSLQYLYINRQRDLQRRMIPSPGTLARCLTTYTSEFYDRPPSGGNVVRPSLSPSCASQQSQSLFLKSI